MDLIIKGGQIPGTTFGSPLSPLIIDPTYGAARFVEKPDEYNNAQGFSGGHYSLASESGLLTGVAAAGAVFSFRAPAQGYAIVKKIKAAWVLTTAYTTAQATDFDVVRCTGFTASDSGGTALAPSAQTNTATNKKRTNLMNSSQLTDLRISTTAALTAGTKVQDAFPFGLLPYASVGATSNTALVTGVPLTDIYAQYTMNEHPMMFAPNEGFNIRAITAMGAAGVIKLYVKVDWAEVPGL
jgi:hypothetical protein